MGRFIYLAIAASAIIGFGNSSASAQVINGCVSKNGTLKVVSDPSDCTSRETPISWSQKGKALRVFDRDGTHLGLFVDYESRGNPRSNSYRVFLEDSEVVVHLGIPSGDLRPRVHEIWFDEPACQGIAYVTQDGDEFRVPPGELFTNDDEIQEGPVRYFIGERGVPIRPVTLLSLFSNTCGGSMTVLPVIPANEVSLSDLGLDAAPFPAPLYVGLPPE